MHRKHVFRRENEETIAEKYADCFPSEGRLSGIKALPHASFLYATAPECLLNGKALQRQVQRMDFPLHRQLPVQPAIPQKWGHGVRAFLTLVSAFRVTAGIWVHEQPACF